MTPHARFTEIVSEIEGARVLRAPAGRGAEVSDVRHDSRTVQPGDVFVARSGQRSDASRYVNDAVNNGAGLVVLEHEVPVPEGPAVILVPDAELALARAASVVWGHPSFGLDVVGITGTNGKTTTTWLLEQAMRSLSKPTGLIGTVEHRMGDTRWPTVHTTPEADDLARLIAAMKQLGARYVAMEVSSHALVLKRVAAVGFRVAVLTNVTQDHLDFHGSLDAYRQTKRSFFLDHGPAFSVLNVDDPVGAELSNLVRDPITYSVGTADRARGSTRTSAMLRVASSHMDLKGIHAVVEAPGGPVTLESPLVGRHNLENLLAAMGAMLALEIPPAESARALAHCVGAPGRLEPVRDTRADSPLVLVDYAHTADALVNVLQAIRSAVTAHGRLLCLFGCGGDRDPTKRAPMGSAVGKGADIAVLTTDNPRTEDPAMIASHAERGLTEHSMPALDWAAVASASRGYLVHLDRGEAIRALIHAARPDDVVLIAGKGHETYQEIHGIRTHFDDREVARAALASRVGGR